MILTHYAKNVAVRYVIINLFAMIAIHGLRIFEGCI